MKTKLHPTSYMRLPQVLGTYELAVALIAVNGASDAAYYRLITEHVVTDIETFIVADLFGKEPQQVAHDVVTMRRREDKHDAKARLITVHQKLADRRSAVRSSVRSRSK